MGFPSVRATARRLGLGRLRPRRVAAAVRASQVWTDVPPRRIKDVKSDRPLPSNAIALTFDDGPDPEVTPRLLKILQANDACATFFMCGLAASRHPNIVRAVAAAGHAIGGHSWDHRVLRDLTEDEWQRQIDDTHALLADLSGAPVRWFRPPWGIVDSGTRERLRLHGVGTMLWSANGADWSSDNPQRIANAAIRGLRPGVVLLLHDAVGDLLSPLNMRRSDDPGHRDATVAATDLILRAANERGLQTISLDLLRPDTIPPHNRPRFPALLPRRPGSGT